MNRRELIKCIGAASAAAIAPKLASSQPSFGEMRLFDVDGVTAFPVINNDGSFISRVCTFPLIEQPDAVLMYGHQIDILYHLAIRDEYAIRIKHDSFAAFQSALESNTPIMDREDGDLMPKDGEIVRFTRRK